MTPGTAVEFLIWLLIAASVISVLAQRLKIPYTVSLVIGGLLLGALKTTTIFSLEPGQRPDWLTPDVILIVFLPALIFEASIRIDVRKLVRDVLPLSLLATVGVLIAAMGLALIVHWALGLPLSFALLLGAIISATDPISVLAIFRALRTAERLALIIEAESLLNDGTAVVLFQIVVVGLTAGSITLMKGVGDFFLAVAGGAAIGLAFGYVVTKITARLDDPQIEISLTSIVAYGSYLVAYHLHLSGVIATCAAGLVIGNVAVPKSMSPRTQAAMQSFWDYAAFVMNSVVFLLIGLEVRVGSLLRSWKPILIAIAAMLLGRALSVYILVPISNLIRSAGKIPRNWQHVAVWGGLRGALALALALSLDSRLPYRNEILNLTFGVVVFSILVQGLTMKTLLQKLDLSAEEFR